MNSWPIVLAVVGSFRVRQVVRCAPLSLALMLLAAAPARHSHAASVPRLAVVIVVDQFRADYLVRFRSFFEARGFNLFLDHGAWLTQARYEHIATVTCAGHATILTGAPPAATGIIANEWWNAEQNRAEYCARDDASPLVDAAGEGRSPRNLLAPTVGDLLKEASGRSRVISVAGKDRAAIMLGGRRADAAYWLEGTRFVTSKYYRAKLPAWAARFNASNLPAQSLGKTWEYALPREAYAQLGPDDDAGETDEAGVGRTFPHRIGAGLAPGSEELAEAFRHSPFHNDVVVAFAMEAVRRERLGRGPATDLLALGLSANDFIGHWFGPDSHEVLDVTVRTDRVLERFFAFLDSEIGLDNTVIVLTADHGVAPIPETLNRLNPAAGAQRISPAKIRLAAESAIEARWGERGDGRHWIVFHGAPYLYFDEPALTARGVDIAAAELTVKAAVSSVPGVFAAYTRAELRSPSAAGPASDVVASVHAQRSGNVLYVTNPYAIEDAASTGTTHGSPWEYDRRVPILWYGPTIEPGARSSGANVGDIAPTLAEILGVGRPNAAAGRVLTEVLRATDSASVSNTGASSPIG